MKEIQTLVSISKWGNSLHFLIHSCIKNQYQLLIFIFKVP